MIRMTFVVLPCASFFDVPIAPVMNAQLGKRFARCELEIANRVIAFSWRGIIRSNDFCRAKRRRQNAILRSRLVLVYSLGQRDAKSNHCEVSKLVRRGQ